ncbi:hypothetical protein VNO80_20030 [Phaseolus coccineus]|uniref:Uncharacterized protein n=1 Tax=Phaseolus coccineus TaxID=3886 RepID=A0AAN9MH55_PHACN
MWSLKEKTGLLLERNSAGGRNAHNNLKHMDQQGSKQQGVQGVNAELVSACLQLASQPQQFQRCLCKAFESAWLESSHADYAVLLHNSSEIMQFVLHNSVKNKCDCGCSQKHGFRVVF